MSEQKQEIGVKYIFRRPRWVDNIYGTGLVFVTGQTRFLPHDLALKFLRHTDTFERDDAKAPPTKTEEQLAAEALAKVEAERKAQEALQQKVFDIHDQIDRMDDKVSLARFAKDSYNLPLDETQPIEAMRVEAKALVDRFGAL
jgi:hypothetical protein